MKLSYVYIYLDPSEPFKMTHEKITVLYKPFYVGKGTCNRWCWILDSNIDDLNRMLKSKIKKLIKKNVVPDVLKIECDSEESAFALEHSFTQAYGLLIEGKGGILYNMRHGGLGGFTLSDAAKHNLSIVNRGTGNPNFGKPWTDERRIKHAHTIEQRRSAGLMNYTPERMKNTWASKRRKYEIIFPDGQTHIIDDLSKWCAETGHSKTILREALTTGVVQSRYARGQRGSGCIPSKLDGVKIRYLD